MTNRMTKIRDDLEREAAIDPMSAAFFQTFGDVDQDPPLMEECVGDSPRANEDFEIIQPRGVETVSENDLPPKGYENAQAPADGAPPKASTISLRLYDGGFGQNFEVSRDFESSLRGLLASLSAAPSIDQLNALIGEREKFRTEAYQARERDRQTIERNATLADEISTLEGDRARLKSLTYNIAWIGAACGMLAGYLLGVLL